MVRGEGWTAEFVEQLAKAFDIDLDVPWAKLPKRERDVVLDGTGGKEFTVKWGSGGKWTMEWEGLVHKLMRSFKTTHSEAMRQYYMRSSPTSPAPPARASGCKPESRAVQGARQEHRRALAADHRRGAASS